MKISHRLIDHMHQPAGGNVSAETAWAIVVTCVRAWQEWMESPSMQRLEHAKVLTAAIDFEPELATPTPTHEEGPPNDGSEHSRR